MPAVAQLFAEPFGGPIRADDADERHTRAERREIVRDVGRAAQPHVLRLEADHRHRRFGRDARHRADDEAVDHDVADDEHVLAGEAADERRVRAPGRAGEASCVRVGPDVVRTAANGSVTISRKSIRNSESPKLYSNSPAASMPTSEASAAAGSARAPVARKALPQRSSEHGDERDPQRERGQAALGGDLHRHVVEVRVHRFHRLGDPVLRIAPPAPGSARRRTADGRAPCAAPRSASPRDRASSDPSRRTST